MRLSLMLIVSGIFISVWTNYLKNTILFIYTPRHMIGYQTNVSTISLLQRLLIKCGKLRHHSDHQIVLSEMYAFSYNMKWVNNTGFSVHYNYRISVFKKVFVSRVNLNCESWVSNGPF